MQESEEVSSVTGQRVVADAAMCLHPVAKLDEERRHSGFPWRTRHACISQISKKMSHANK
jgi:hypothetical protein